MGSWRDFLNWFKPTFIAEREKLVEDLMESNEALHREVGRLRKRNWRLEGQLETAKGREEAQSQRIILLQGQARRCKCRS